MRRDRFANIREPANSDAATIESGHGSQDRNALPGVIRSRPGRVVAMVSRKHQEITVSNAGKDLRDADVEAGERPGVSLGISTMPEIRVKLDEIGKYQAAVRGGPCQFDQTIHSFPVVTPIVGRRNSTSGENVVDLSHRMGRSTGLNHPVQQRRFRCMVRIVAPV